MRNIDNWKYYEDDEDVRFRTFNVSEFFVKDKSDYIPKYGRVLAVTVPLNEEKTKFACQFAYLCPKDLREGNINKIGAKFLALARLNSHRAIIFSKKEDEKLLDLLKIFILQEADRKNILWLKNKTINHIY